MSKLSASDHQKVLALGLAFQRADAASKNVYIRDELVKLFEKTFVKMRLMPEEVGILPGNRNSDVITSTGVWVRGRRILASGFSKAAIGTLYAFEDDPIEQHIAKHTVAVTNTDEFGTFDLFTVKVGQANWTHCNQFANMVKCSTKCSDPDIPCIDGRIDSDSILKDPMNGGLSEYITMGMYYRVFPHWAEKAYDWLPDLFQTACNQEQQVQEGESWLQVLNKIGQRSSEMSTSGRIAKCNNAISTAVLRSQPPNAEDVPDMVDFYEKWGGGTGQKFVKDVNRFCKAKNLSPSIRVSGRTFRALAALNFGTDMPAHAVMAVLKRAACSQKVIDGIASSVSGADIAKFDKKLKKEFMQVDGLIRAAEKILDDNDIEEPRRSLKGSWLQLTLIDHLLGRPNGEGQSFANTDDIVKQHLRDVFGVVTEAPAAALAPASSSNIVQYDSGGSAIDVAKQILLNKGFEIGKNYMCKRKENSLVASPISYKLISIDGDGTSKLQAYSHIGVLGAKYLTIAGERLATDFAIFEKKYEVNKNYPSNEARHDGKMKEDVLVGRVKECLVRLAATMIDHQLDIRTSPSKGIYAKADLTSEIAIGLLRLTPVASSVMKFDPKKKGAEKNLRTQCTTIRPDKSEFITTMTPPHIVDNLCNAFWFVGKTDVKELANMELTTENVTYILASVGKLKISGHEHIVKIPVYINTSIIKKGEELLWYVPKIEAIPGTSHKGAPTSLAVGLSSKRQKTTNK